MKQILMMCLGLLWAGTVFTGNAVTIPYNDAYDFAGTYPDAPEEQDRAFDVNPAVYSKPLLTEGEEVVSGEIETMVFPVKEPPHDALAIHLDDATFSNPVEIGTGLDKSLFIQALAVVILAIGSLAILAVFMKVTAVFTGDLVMSPVKETHTPSTPSSGPTC